MSTPQPQSETISDDTVRDAEKPFDASAKADVILRSVDSVDFFVLKAILSLASSVFDDMFSLDQGEAKGDMKNGLSIVQLAEDGVTLCNLLQLIYPYRAVEPSGVEICAKVGEAARKYAIDGVLQRLQRIFLASDAVVKGPLSAFCMGTRFGWVEVMMEAGLNTLSVPLRQLFECNELRVMSAKEYADLLRWRFACQDAVSRLISQWKLGHGHPQPRATAFVSMANSLERLLKETGCPRSTVLMQDSVVQTALDQTTSASHYCNVASYRTYMMNEIEKTVLKVPMKIGDIWVVPE
jgi:hypothetical protein